MIFLWAVFWGTVGTLFSMALAARWGIVDRPGMLKIHAVPVPRFGGVGMVLAFCVLLPAPSWGAAGSLVMAAVGALDDRWDLLPRQKLLGQIGGGACLALPWILRGAPGAALIMLFAAVFLANAVNLLDGMDGLAAGVAAIGAWGLAAIHASRGLPTTVPLILAGASVGFLLWNLPPARTFMGDVGSLFLGGALAWQIGGVYSTDLSALLGCCFCVGVPCFDTLLGIVRRLLTGKPLFSGDRDHLYDQLARRWGDKNKAVRATWGLAAILAVLGCWVAALPPEGALVMTCLVAGVFGGVAVAGGFLKPFQPKELVTTGNGAPTGSGMP